MFRDWKLHVYLGNQASQIRTHSDEFSQSDIKDVHPHRDFSKTTQRMSFSPIQQIHMHKWIIFIAEAHWRQIQVC